MRSLRIYHSELMSLDLCK